MQELLPGMRPKRDWTPTPVSELPDWGGQARVGLDCETKDPLLKKLGIGVRRGGHVVGVSFAFVDGRSWYLPIRHEGGGNLPEDEVLRYLRGQIKRFTGEVVGANLQYDLDYLMEEGCDFGQVRRHRDVLIAAPLINELHHRYSLNAVLERAGMPLKDEALLEQAAREYGVDPKAEMYKLHSAYVGQYASGDALKPLRLLEEQEQQIASEGLERVWDLESRVLPILVKMRRRGVSINQDQLARVEDWCRARESKWLGEVHRLSGVRVKEGDTFKARVLAQVMDALDIRYNKTPTGKPSITAAWLESLDHDVGHAIREARKAAHLMSNSVDAVRRHMVNGRIHGTFNQLRKTKDDGSGEEGARYGRLSGSDPNLQNQPARDPEIGPMWRSVYEADPGGVWAQLDYSQQEPKLLLHFAVRAGPRSIGQAAHAAALRARDEFRRDPTKDNHTMFTQMVYGDEVVDAEDFKHKRGDCKIIFLGICYNKGGASLCRDLNLPTKMIENRRGFMVEVAGERGQELLDLVDKRVPYVRKMAKECERLAQRRGYIVTLSGRRCRFPQDEHGNFDWCHKALNRLIQGSAADQTKYAMVALDDAGFPMQLQVHDEIDGTFESREQAEAAAEVMRECVKLEVPNKVDAECGPNWGDVS